MPLGWEALETAYSTDFTVHTAPGILDAHGDPWAGVAAARADLHEVLAMTR